MRGDLRPLESKKMTSSISAGATNLASGQDLLGSGGEREYARSASLLCTDCTELIKITHRLMRFRCSLNTYKLWNPRRLLRLLPRNMIASTLTSRQTLQTQCFQGRRSNVRRAAASASVTTLVFAAVDFFGSHKNTRP